MTKTTTSTVFPETTIGLDLSDKTSKLCRLDSRGRVVERRTLRNTRRAYGDYFAGLDPSRVVLECGTHSPWISRLLTEAGHEVVVANARRVELIARSQRKTDKIDAELLARLGRFDTELLHGITHRGAQAQADLATLRSRAALVRARTQLVCHVRGSVKSVGGTLVKCDPECFHKRAPEQVPEELRDALLPVIETIGVLNERIKQLGRHAERVSQERYPETALLRQVTGVGALTALCFVLVLDDPHRMRRSRDVGPFLGLVPGVRDSGQSEPQMRITKAGDVMLRSLLVQAAHYVLGPFGPDCDLRRWGEHIAGQDPRRGKKRAVVAVARKLSVLLHHLWVTGEVYDPNHKTSRPTAAA